MLLFVIGFGVVRCLSVCVVVCSLLVVACWFGVVCLCISFWSFVVVVCALRAFVAHCSLLVVGCSLLVVVVCPCVLLCVVVCCLFFFEKKGVAFCCFGVYCCKLCEVYLVWFLGCVSLVDVCCVWRIVI